MSTTGSEDRRGGSSAAQGGDGPSERNEVSGLHDIRALARNTIQRHQELHPDDLGEVVDSLLATASPASMGQVLLPEPGREVKPAAVVAVERAERGGGSGWGKTMFFSAAVLVAGGAVAFVMHRNAQKKDQQQVLAMAPTGSDRGAGPAPSSAGPARPEVTPIERSDPPPGQPAEAAVPGDPGAQPGAAPAPREERPTDKALAIKADPRAVAKDKDKDAKDKPGAGAPADADKGAAGTTPPPVVEAPADKPADKPKPTEPNLDDLFGQAPPPADEPEEKPAEAPAEQLPLKLAPDQVKKGMRSVTPRVSDCFTRYKVPGTVVIKVKIEADGTVSSSIAVDKFANTETGFCVAEAVTLAKFPKFNGPPMQFNYPFKLQAQ